MSLVNVGTHVEMAIQKCLRRMDGYIILDEIGCPDTAFNMASINPNGDLKSPGDPEKKIPETDAEKQPLSGKKEERWWTTLMQVAVPFFIAGCGTIGAGLVLGSVRNWEVFQNVSAIFVLVPSLSGLKARQQLVYIAIFNWEVFQNVSAIFVLVPSLSGLKGNLDMCLASRLSTQANLGNMETPREVISMVVGNISLVQVQAIVAATVVSMFAIVVNSITDRAFNGSFVLLLIASAVFTATTTCFVLDFVMVLVIFGSQKFKVNPDNVATPLAASIGDIVSNSVLAVTAQYMYDQIKISLWQPIALMCVYYSLLPLWVFIVWRNKYTKKVLMTGWTPVISALYISGMKEYIVMQPAYISQKKFKYLSDFLGEKVGDEVRHPLGFVSRKGEKWIAVVRLATPNGRISGIGGIVLDQAVEKYQGYEVFQPIVNGIGGNLVCVQSSRLTTHLHQTAILGILPEDTRIVEWPWKTLFFGKFQDQAVEKYQGYEVFQPIVNGIGGNLVCVQSSRLTTHLHQTAILGILPEDTRIVEWPWKTLFFGTAAAKVARMLLVLALCGQVVFMIVADFIYQGVVSIQFAFGLTYLLCSMLQVMVLLYMAYMLIHFMWKRKKDPDNAAIPYLTALGDLLGSVFLGLAFVILSIFGLQYGNNVPGT
ncbi:Solute carrier family 41 member 1 [Papilio xuthus]|uniref:Solute carrier family 41 member 1 n=1 Tax=Papilio xuthus TaxID=66420 RepID=A0A194Q5K4_PAPXU|nr:Solute carrier family 41 member 1 [Papilio xuthus]